MVATNLVLREFVPLDDKPVQGGYTLIRVWVDAKIRYQGGPLVGNRDYYPDKDWILARADVPNLSDAEWLATPTGWKIRE